jgi:hypothetical protein
VPCGEPSGFLVIDRSLRAFSAAQFFKVVGPCGSSVLRQDLRLVNGENGHPRCMLLDPNSHVRPGFNPSNIVNPNNTGSCEIRPKKESAV